MMAKGPLRSSSGEKTVVEEEVEKRETGTHTMWKLFFFWRWL